MTKSTRRILKTVCLSDGTIDAESIDQALRVLEGQRAGKVPESGAALLSQAAKARQLGVSRFTIIKMVRLGKLHPLELLPGLVRYRSDEFLAIDNLKSERSDLGEAVVHRRDSK